MQSAAWHAHAQAMNMTSPSRRKERLYDREAVEAVLGRDTSSVFPTEIAKLAAEERKSAADSLGGRNFITEKEQEELRAEQAGPAGESIVPEKPLAEVLAEAKQAKEDAFQAQWKQMKTGGPRALHSSFKLRLRCCWYDSRTCAVLGRGPLLHGAAGEVLISVTSLAVTLCMNGGETPVDKTCMSRTAGKNRPLDEEELQFLGVLQQQAEQADSEWHAEQARELDAYQQVTLCAGAEWQNSHCAAVFHVLN